MRWRERESSELAVSRFFHGTTLHDNASDIGCSGGIPSTSSLKDGKNKGKYKKLIQVQSEKKEIRCPKQQ